MPPTWPACSSRCPLGEQRASLWEQAARPEHRILFDMFRSLDMDKQTRVLQVGDWREAWAGLPGGPAASTYDGCLYCSPTCARGLGSCPPLAQKWEAHVRELQAGPAAIPDPAIDALAAWAGVSFKARQAMKRAPTTCEAIEAQLLAFLQQQVRGAPRSGICIGADEVLAVLQLPADSL